MQATILGNRRGINTQHNKQYLLEINDEKYKDKKSIASLFGKKAIYKTISGKKIQGKIVDSHGNKGVVRAIFEKGLPGNSKGEIIEIL